MRSCPVTSRIGAATLPEVKNAPQRSESEILGDLAALCTKPGYVHALAYLCFRDNVITYAGAMTEADMRKLFEPSHLIRTEINTLIGLMVREPIDWSLPDPQTVQSYSNASEKLLEELHHALSFAMMGKLVLEAKDAGSFEPFGRGAALREPIFYSGESAYNFQYIDFADRRYAADEAWLLANQGFTMALVRRVAHAISQVQSDQLIPIRDQMRQLPPARWTMLPFFAVTVAAVAVAAGLDEALTERILMAFTFPADARNEGFRTLQDFNAATATPLLRMPDGMFVSLQAYALAESLYESPFFWMTQDKAYLPELEKHRGDFTEAFVAERLALVFGRDRVFSNVDIYESKATRVGEIDVLVLWGDRALVVQTKSKRLTVAARKGNDQMLRDDFKKSVQDAYDQATLCAGCLGDPRYRLVTSAGVEISLPFELREIYPLCIVSDHYPALSFQVRQFLKTGTAPRLLAPLVADVFTIDAMTEMLQSPLHFLSYVNRRAQFADQILASQELTVLAYHLKHNLWLEDGVTMMHLADDFSAGLDLAMAVRRTGVEGAATPKGILTKYAGSTLGRVIQEIEARPEPATINFGFMLLTLSGETVQNTSQSIDALAARARRDGANHDLSVGMGPCGSGLTVHCNNDPMPVAVPRLESHCAMRKYREQASQWFGLCISPAGSHLRFGVSLGFPWAQDAAMDMATRDMPAPRPPREAFAALLGRGRKKVGRNDLCPCGSGMKYKKCCLRR